MQPLSLLQKDFEVPKEIRPLNGLSFNPSNDIWAFNDGVTTYYLNFKKITKLAPELIQNIRQVLIWYAENTSGGQLESHYWQLLNLLKFIYDSHKTVVTSITSADLINYRANLGRDREWYLGSLASFLKRWHKFQLPGVTQDAIRFLNQVRLKGVEKGKAVRTMDPEIGPFSDIEVEAICAAINQSYANGVISKPDYLLTWLFFIVWTAC